MAGDTFRDRMMAATRIDRQAERTIIRRIAKLYEQAAEDMANRAAASRSGSLTERFAWELSQSLRERTRELWAQVRTITQSGMRDAAQRAVGVQTSFLADIGQMAGLDLQPTIRRVFATTRDDAVSHILRGGVYGGEAPTLSRRIWNNAAAQSGQIEQVIAQAVAKGESPTRLAKALEAYVNPKAVEPSNWNDIYDIPFTYKVDYNAKRLAVTSTRHASWGATVSAARLNPYAQYFHWELTPAHVIFDICDAHAVHDEGMGEGNFSIDAAPLPHPFCTCLYYVDTDKSLEEMARELRSWADGERDNPLLERAFGEWAGKRPKKREETLFSDKYYVPVKPDKDSSIPDEVIRSVQNTIARVKEDFPALDKLEEIVFTDVPGIAAASADGTSILLDKSIFSSMQKAHQTMIEIVREGHSANAEDPMFIIAHELGHTVLIHLAVQRAGLPSFPRVGGLPLMAYQAKRDEILRDLFVNSIFTNESVIEIYKMIEKEMGRRALDHPQEMLAQAFGMHYYGKGEHPISDSMVSYIKRIFQR